MRKSQLLLAGAISLAWITTSHAGATDEEKCAAAKIAAASKYAACRAGVDKKAEAAETSPDYTDCTQKQSDAWTKIETKYGTHCLTIGDQGPVQGEVAAMTDCLTDRFTPAAPASTVSSIDVQCIPCPSGGAVVGGKCWLLGVAGDNCSSTCAAQGLVYDSATNDYAGTDAGAEAHCLWIAEQLGFPYQAGTFGISGPTNVGVGCSVQGHPFLCPGPATDIGNYIGFQRICACH